MAERDTVIDKRFVSIDSFRGVIMFLLFFSIFGALQMKSDLNLIEDFRKDSPIRIADEILNEKFAGTSQFNVVFKGKNADDIKDPAILKKKVKDFFRGRQAFLEEFEGTYGRIPEDIRESLPYELEE